MTDTASQAQSLFRTAAIFYGNDPTNYGSSNVRNIQKLIESSLFHSTNEGMTVHEISDFIRTNYLLDIDDSEITSIVANSRNSDRYIQLTDRNGIHFVLSQKRRMSIEATQTSKSLDTYIDEYILMESLASEAKDIIIQYLYSIFTSNLESFRRLFQLKKAASLAVDINQDYSDSEAKFINGFLLWDNQGKDQAVFNFASYALEFCMITNRKDSSNINEQLGLKEFYIDTNIVYRAIGLNGEDRKQRTLQLLEKLQATNCKLYISTEAKAELIASLNDKFERLRKSHNPAVNSKVFQEFVTYDDIYSAYHRWCVGRVNTSVDLFGANILANFDELRKKYSIQTDGDCPFDRAEKDDLLNKMASDIKSYSKRKTQTMALRDALNVLWVELKRLPNQASLFSAKHFLLSSDKGLRCWDVVRNDGNSPRIVIHPSEWLSLILRYSHRTADDFKSFISFLTLRNNEAPMSNEELNIAISAIAEIAEDIDVQKTACENLLKMSFDRKEKNLTESTIRDLAKVEAERELEKRLKQAIEEKEHISEAYAALTDENSSLKDDIHSQKSIADKHINDLVLQNETLQRESSESRQKGQATIDELKEQLRQSEEGRKREQEEYKRYKANRIINNWIITRVLIAIIVGALVVFYLLASEEGDWLYNLKQWITSREDLADFVKNGLTSIFGIAALVIFPWRPLFKKIFKRSASLGSFE